MARAFLAYLPRLAIYVAATVALSALAWVLLTPASAQGATPDVRGLAVDELTVARLEAAVRAAHQWEALVALLKVLTPVLLLMLSVIGYFLVDIRRQVASEMRALVAQQSEARDRMDALRDQLPQRYVSREDWLRSDGQTHLRLDGLSRDMRTVLTRLEAR